MGRQFKRKTGACKPVFHQFRQAARLRFLADAIKGGGN
jgi:hypothetical protein